LNKKQLKRMKKLFITLVCSVAMATTAFSQGVGIGGTPDGSAMLDVQSTSKGIIAPRVALTAANVAGPITNPATGLIVYNTATAGTGQNRVTPGYYYNAGTPTAPQWLRFDGTRMWFKASATAGLTNYTSTTFATIPGTTITFTIPTGMTADVYIWGYAGAMEVNAVTTNYAMVDIAVFRNGAFIPVGGYNRISLDGQNINAFATTSFNTMETLTAGTYIYDLRGRRYSGTEQVNIGGNCTTDVNCGELTIFVVLK
jgi:hypothetical protein